MSIRIKIFKCTGCSYNLEFTVTQIKSYGIKCLQCDLANVKHELIPAELKAIPKQNNESEILRKVTDQ